MFRESIRCVPDCNTFLLFLNKADKILLIFSFLCFSKVYLNVQSVFILKKTLRRNYQQDTHRPSLLKCSAQFISISAQWSHVRLAQDVQ